MNGYQSRAVSLLLGCLSIASTGCAFAELPSLLKENTRTVRASTEGIAANTREVGRSSEITKELLPAMQGLRTLEQPMTEVAKLGPSLTAVAALDTSMSHVAALNAPMRQLTTLAPAMQAVSRLDDPMMRVAALDKSMQEVAALRSELRAVAELQRSMADLGALREPMMRVAELRQPMTQIAALGPLGNPLGIAVVAIVGLLLWGAVTFVAVRLAVSTALASRPRSVA
jgi:hypothetical protein